MADKETTVQGKDDTVRERMEAQAAEFLNRSVREASQVSWGLVILIAFGVYALVNIVVLVVKFFN